APDRPRQRRTAQDLRGDHGGREPRRSRSGAARAARMPEHILFLTGRLAKPRVAKVLAAMQTTDFSYDVQDVGVKVAALMTGDLIRRRLPAPVAADRIMLPGRCRADLAALSSHYGIPVLRGPDDVKDLPEFFGQKGRPRDLSRHDVCIFAEIVEAPTLDVAGSLRRGGRVPPRRRPP